MSDCVGARARVCVCVCVCARERARGCVICVYVGKFIIYVCD